MSYCFFAAITFGIISGVIFADALRRIKIILKQTPHLQVNQVSFRLYVFVLAFHTIVNSVCLFFINRGFNRTTQEAYEIQIISRIVLFSTLWFLQIIMLIIFYRWTSVRVRHDRRITIDKLNNSRNSNRKSNTNDSNSSLNQLLIEDENEEARDRVNTVAWEVWGESETDLREQMFSQFILKDERSSSNSDKMTVLETVKEAI